MAAVELRQRRFGDGYRQASAQEVSDLTAVVLRLAGRHRGLPIWHGRHSDLEVGGLELDARPWQQATRALACGAAASYPMHGAFGCVRARQQEGKDLWTAACRSAPIFSSAYPLRQMLT
jgi:hypothetical protein